MEFRRTGTLQTLRPDTATQDREAYYWQQFGSPTFIKEFSPINAIHFVPSAGPSLSAGITESASDVAARQKFAITSATRVQVYSMRSGKVTKTMSRFKDVARSGQFRSDGKLLVAGDDSGLVQVFDAQSRSVLRQLKGHSLSVHSSSFSTEPTQILTASDDRTVRLWDMPQEAELRCFDSHQDYVRCAQVSSDNASLILSGSYDGTVKLWDIRMAENDGCAMTMLHGAPVEDVKIFPTGGGGAALSAGGPVLRSWDLMMGGRCRNAVSNHSKTITSLAISLESGADNERSGHLAGVRILSAGLDQLVKVYDPAKDYKVVHTMRYSAPLLCLAISPDETQLVAGMADGTLCIRKKSARDAEKRQRQIAADQGSTPLLATQVLTFNEERDRLTKGSSAQMESRADSGKPTAKLSSHDRLLKAFRYRDALDDVLRKGVRPEVTFALLNELRERSTVNEHGAIVLDGLRRAIQGRDDVTLEPLCRFLLRHGTNARWSPIVCDTLHVVLDTYASVLGQSPVIDELFGKMWAKFSNELDVQRQLVEVRGALEMVLLRSAMT
jgi:U3 small nucleolar RNA-associated protein 15